MTDHAAIRTEAAYHQLQPSLVKERLPSSAGMSDEELIELATRSHVKIAKLMARVFQRMDEVKLFGEDRAKYEPGKDSVGMQILFEMVERYEALRDTPLTIEESELQREKALGDALSAIQKAQNDLFAHAHRINEHSTKLLMERQKLQLAVRAHGEHMEIEREKLAKAVTKAKVGLTDAELKQIAEGGGG